MDVAVDAEHGKLWLSYLLPCMILIYLDFVPRSCGKPGHVRVCVAGVP